MRKEIKIPEKEKIDGTQVKSYSPFTDCIATVISGTDIRTVK